jgi:hypothetical protein
MYIIGENIHIISEKVKEALTARAARFFQNWRGEAGRSWRTGPRT